MLKSKDINKKKKTTHKPKNLNVSMLKCHTVGGTEPYNL